jgi:hypothetical protein
MDHKNISKWGDRESYQDYEIKVHGTRSQARIDNGWNTDGKSAEEKAYWRMWEHACPFVRNGHCCTHNATYNDCCGYDPHEESPNQIDVADQVEVVEEVDEAEPEVIITNDPLLNPTDPPLPLTIPTDPPTIDPPVDEVEPEVDELEPEVIITNDPLTISTDPPALDPPIDEVDPEVEPEVDNLEPEAIITNDPLTIPTDPPAIVPPDDEVEPDVDVVEPGADELEPEVIITNDTPLPLTIPTDPPATDPPVDEVEPEVDEADEVVIANDPPPPLTIPTTTLDTTQESAGTPAVCEYEMGETDSTYCNGTGVVFLSAIGPDPPDGVDIIWGITSGADTAGMPTVIFKVNKPFDNTTDMYVQYNEKVGELGAADAVCVGETDVADCNSNATEIEAACMEPKGSGLSFTVVSIFFVTNDAAVGTGGAVEVDDCCYEDPATKAASTPVVEYTYEIYCTCPVVTARRLRGSPPWHRNGSANY